MALCETVKNIDDSKKSLSGPPDGIFEIRQIPA